MRVGAATTQVFTITTPSTSVQLAPNRIGEVAFTVTDVSDEKLRVRVRVTPSPGTPPAWFSVEGDAEQVFDSGAARQFTVRVEPPLGVAAGSYSFRLDAIGTEHPDEDYAEGPAVQLTVPGSKPPRVTTPRGYLTTLVGALVGGVLGELVIVVLLLLRHHTSNCDTISCVVGDTIGEIFFFLFAILAAYVLMLIGAAIGSAVALRIRGYLGPKLTGTFLGILMIPWLIAITLTVFQFLHNLVVLAVLAPILLVAVPAVLARGGVLLIRTHHI
jgi:hypothetical protein